MKKIGIMTDSHSGILTEEAEKLGIKVLPMPFYIDDELYLEGVDLSREEFYEKLRQGVNVSTSQPSPGDVMDLWEELLKKYDEIHIENLQIFANHGVYPEENALGQKFIVSLVLYADLRAAGEHDNLDASIDYGSVCHDVDGYLREHTFKLIEAAAEGVAQMLLRRYPLLLGVRVKLDKPWAPVGLPLASCGVEIERVR